MSSQAQWRSVITFLAANDKYATGFQLHFVIPSEAFPQECVVEEWMMHQALYFERRTLRSRERSREILYLANLILLPNPTYLKDHTYPFQPADRPLTKLSPPLREMETKKDIRMASNAEVIAFCQEQGWEKFRGKQLIEWIWQKAVTSFDEMTNLSLTMREALKAHWTFHPLRQDAIQHSADGTIKYRWLCHDGNKIESVLIPVPDEQRYTICVSSQVGCSLSCKFCATGQMKRMRNLDSAEIWDQVVMVDKDCQKTYGHRITNIVYMGMGEPLLNYANVLGSIQRITSPDGYGMSPRRITVSTAGIEKAIRRLADDSVKFNLALSLHAADDGKRSSIMPINDQNNLASLMSAIQYFHQKTGGRISFEYILFKGLNDTPEDAKRLAGLCKQFPVRVNIIEYNPIAGVAFIRAEDTTIDRFGRTLRDLGVMATVRRSRGKDIDAACGQLANK